jgi:hypothetical protein
MVNCRQIFIAEKGGELFEIGEIAPHRMGRSVFLVLQIAEKGGNVFPHKNTVSYQAGFCKDVSNIDCGRRTAKKEMEYNSRLQLT